MVRPNDRKPISFAESLTKRLSVCAVQMSFYSIAAKYNGPLEAAHAHIDDDRYDMGS